MRYVGVRIFQEDATKITRRAECGFDLEDVVYYENVQDNWVDLSPIEPMVYVDFARAGAVYILEDYKKFEKLIVKAREEKKKSLFITPQ